ncbi:MAG: F1-ATP synthase, delta subunit [uncultured bacterium]|nr:MAG: F1-ATP synthase, delta subunit [uncultured bacterium]
MANLSSQKYSNIARPYALAAFEVASKKQQLAEWKAFLDSASDIANDPTVSKLLTNPEMTAQRLNALFSEVLASLLDDERRNFLRLLAQNQRLMVLPEIAELYRAYLAKLEKISSVRIITAIEITNEIKQNLARALTKRMQREVTIECEINPSILGGAIIHIGDRVIDGSIRGKLTRLYTNLTS